MTTKLTASSFSDISLARIAIYILILTICIPPDIIISAESANRLFLVPAATGLTAFVWLIKSHGRIAITRMRHYRWFWSSLFVFTLIAIASSFAAPNPGESILLVVTYGVRFLMAFSVAQLLSTDWILLRRTLLFLAIALSAVTVLSIAGIEGTNNIREMDVNGVAISRVGVGLGDPNFTAMVLNIGLGGAIAWFMTARRRWHRLAAVSSVLILTSGVARTVSIGGVIGLLTTLVLTWWILVRKTRRRRFSATVLIGVLLTIIVGVSGIAYKARVSQQIQRSEENIGSIGSERLNLAVGGMRMVVAHPLLGVGPANVATMMPDYLIFPIFKPNQGPHNLFITVASETGLLSMTAFIAAVAAVILILARGVRNAILQQFAEGIIVGRILQIVIISTLIQSLGLSLERQPFLWLLLALAMAYPIAQGRILRRIPKVVVSE